MRSTTPLWRASSWAREHGALGTDTAVDVAIVGGGVTGLTTALLLADAGKSVALLEGRSLGSGVTGASTAHLTEAIDMRYHVMEDKLGKDAARAVRASTRDAIETVCSLAADACGFARVDGYLFAEKPAEFAELDVEQQAATRAGAMVERRQTPSPLGDRAALCFGRQGQVNPRAYVDKLAERAVAAGARIYEHSPVVDVETKGEPVLTTAAGHRVRARSVVLATHRPSVKASVQLQLASYRSYVVATPVYAPVSALFWDMQDPYHYIRGASIEGQAHVLVGGADHKTGATLSDQGGPYEELIGYAARMGWQPTIGWSAQIIESADGLPFIGKPEPEQDMYVAAGFGGNGMTFGTISARIIADGILGRQNPYAELYRADRIKPLAALGAVVAETAGSAAHAIHDRLHPASDDHLSDLGLDTARIIKSDGDSLAAYRDLDGVLHVVSATCTHMGCRVVFNPLEKSWDCPCHGSRFDVEGQVLHGPATKALERHRR